MNSTTYHLNNRKVTRRLAKDISKATVLKTTRNWKEKEGKMIKIILKDGTEKKGSFEYLYKEKDEIRSVVIRTTTTTRESVFNYAIKDITWL